MAATAGLLGSNFTAQLDQIKKGVTQVSTIVKDTLVVDESWDEENDHDGVEGGGEEEVPDSREKELMRECKRLDRLHKVNE